MEMAIGTEKKNSILSNGSRPSISSNTGNGSLPSTEMDPVRGNWSNPFEFILACVGYAIGLGNVWRFPYLVFRNGGGAFLVPYILMVFVIGLPIFFAELFVGQYPGQGPIKAYINLAPFFHGLGYCTLVVIFFVTIYYMVVMAWIFFYFFASFSSELGWGSCSNGFNTKDCFSSFQNQICLESNSNSEMDKIFWNQTCSTVKDVCGSFGMTGKNETFCLNSTTLVPISSVVKRVLASEEYFYEYVLGIGDATWHNWGYPRWQLVLCLLLGWIVAFFCLIKGVQSAGKVVYFTALFPYVILTALLIRGATLEGAAKGIMFYIQPKWETLLEPSVWGDAASQIFYSFGLACGSLVTFSSYNHFKNNCHTDAIVVSFTNVFTAIFAGFAVFSILGFMAHNIGAEVSDVVQSGPGLAFIAYPEAVLLMPLPQLWSVLFFFMMLILGMGSQFGGIEALCTAVIDHWPHLRHERWRVTAGVCIVCFIAALPLVCNGGVFMFTLMEWHTASWAILLLGLAEVVVISWVYGMQRTFQNIHEMGIKMNRFVKAYWWSVWVVITPVASVGVFIFTMTDIGPTKFRDDYFPVWADVLGWSMGAATLAPFPIFLIYRYYMAGPKRDLKYFLHSLFKPTPHWKPQDPSFIPSMTEKPTRKMSGIDNAGFDQA